MSQLHPMRGRPDGYYRTGRYPTEDDRVYLVPPILTCFGCREVQAKDLDPEELVYVFALDPWGAGYAHIRCLPEDFKATIDAREAERSGTS